MRGLAAELRLCPRLLDLYKAVEVFAHLLQPAVSYSALSSLTLYLILQLDFPHYQLSLLVQGFVLW